MSFQILKNRLQRLRKQIFLLVLLQGLSKLAMWFLAFAVVSFVLDYSLVLPRTGRLLIFAVACAVTCYLAARYSFLPLRAKIRDDELVVAIEKANPHLEEKLISAFQFARLLKDPDYQDSREMSEALIREAESALPQIRFRGILNWKYCLAIAAVPLALSTALAIFIIGYGDLARIWSQRDLMFREVAWPRSNDLLLQCDVPFRVSPNCKIGVEVVPEAAVEAIFLRYRTLEEGSGGPWQKIAMEAEDGKFFAREVFAPATVQFFVEEGDRHSRLYQIESDESSTQSVVVINYPDDRIVKRRGEDLPLRVVAKGKIVTEAWICWEQNRQQRRDNLIPEEENTFEYNSLESLTQDLTFYFQGGDDRDRRPVYQVTVLESPSVEEFSFWFEYPKYTQIPDTPERFPVQQKHGSIKALTGTYLNMRLWTNIPIEEGKIELEKRRKSREREADEITLEFGHPLSAGLEECQELSDGRISGELRRLFDENDYPLSDNASVKSKIEDRKWWIKDYIGTQKHAYLAVKEKDGLRIYNARYLYASLQMVENGSYKVVLTPQEGFPDPAPATYYIHTDPDPAPVIQQILPKVQRLMMVPSGRLPLHYKITDNFGIGALDILYQVDKGEFWQEISIFRTEKEHPAQWDMPYSLELSQLSKMVSVGDGVPLKKEEWAKGDRLLVKVRAKDNNPNPLEGRSESQDLVIALLDKGELRELLDRQLQDLKRQLRRVSEQQRELRKEIEDFIGFIEKERDVQAGDVPTILQRYVAQEDISREIAGTTDELREIMATAENNDLWDAPRHEQIAGVREVLLVLAREDDKTKNIDGISPAAGKSLMASYNSISNNREEGKKHLRDAVSFQNKILEDLEIAIGKLGEWEDFHEIVRDVEAFLEQQKEWEPHMKTLVDEAKDK